MGKPLMLQEDDVIRIEALKQRLGAPTKVDVVRSGLDLLERAVDRKERVARWRQAAPRVAEGSRKALQDFRRHSRLKRPD